MKDFDLTEIRAARTMNEVDYRFKKEGVVACRREFDGGLKKRVKRFIDKALMKEGRL